MKLFGTDGIRSLANKPPMDVATIMKIGMAAGSYFRKGQHRHSVVIGKDTRLSGYLVENALTAGFLAVGVDVFLVGPMPTPAVAMLTRSLRADLGVVISASHNPFQDNGIKFFNHRGLKLSPLEEKAIETIISKESFALADPDKLGRAKRLEEARGRYIEYVKNTFPKKLSLMGLKVVIDCANGAAYSLAPKVFYELGADVIAIGTNPNGTNINKEFGSTATSNLITEVLHHKADIGIALDGDADRLIICDEKGRIVDGDQIIAAIATYCHRHKEVKGKIIATDMSNIGLENYIKSIGLGFDRSRVGDKNVVAKMLEENSNIGGEQSGHIILSDYSTTGDGILAALKVLAILVEQHKPASSVLQVFTPMPQVLKNYKPTKAADKLLDDADYKKLIAKIEKTIGGDGRILIRKSGTENLIRVMLEGSSFAQIDELSREPFGASRLIKKRVLPKQNPFLL
jgi:phosphoglucosamine mutase